MMPVSPSALRDAHRYNNKNAKNYMNALAYTWVQFAAQASGPSSRHLVAVYTCADHLHSHQTIKNVIPARFAIPTFMYMLLYLSYLAYATVVNSSLEIGCCSLFCVGARVYSIAPLHPRKTMNNTP